MPTVWFAAALGVLWGDWHRVDSTSTQQLCSNHVVNIINESRHSFYKWINNHLTFSEAVCYVKLVHFYVLLIEHELKMKSTVKHAWFKNSLNRPIVTIKPPAISNINKQQAYCCIAVALHDWILTSWFFCDDFVKQLQVNTMFTFLVNSNDNVCLFLMKGPKLIIILN